MTNFRPAIRRALRPCQADLLGPFLTRLSLAPKAARANWHRSTFERLAQLGQMARSGGLPNASHLAKQFNTSIKTIGRDLESLKRMGFRFAYVADQWRYQTIQTPEAA